MSAGSAPFYADWWPWNARCDGADEGCANIALGDGDCDSDLDCVGDLICGTDNCVGDMFDEEDDCCDSQEHTDDREAKLGLHKGLYWHNLADFIGTPHAVHDWWNFHPDTYLGQWSPTNAHVGNDILVRPVASRTVAQIDFMLDGVRSCHKLAGMAELRLQDGFVASRDHPFGCGFVMALLKADGGEEATHSFQLDPGTKIHKFDSQLDAETIGIRFRAMARDETNTALCWLNSLSVLCEGGAAPKVPSSPSAPPPSPPLPPALPCLDSTLGEQNFSADTPSRRCALPPPPLVSPPPPTPPRLPYRCDGLDEGCTRIALGDGDCDDDHDCEEGLICGIDNCIGDQFDATDDCCDDAYVSMAGKNWVSYVPPGTCAGLLEERTRQTSAECFDARLTFHNHTTGARRSLTCEHLMFPGMRATIAAGATLQVCQYTPGQLTQTGAAWGFDIVSSWPADCTIVADLCPASCGAAGYGPCESSTWTRHCAIAGGYGPCGPRALESPPSSLFHVLSASPPPLLGLSAPSSPPGLLQQVDTVLVGFTEMVLPVSGFLLVLSVMWGWLRWSRRPRRKVSVAASARQWTELMEAPSMSVGADDSQGRDNSLATQLRIGIPTPSTRSMCLSDEIIGRGGFSTVYAGTWDTVKVAVKVLNHHKSDLLREAKILRRLRHPCVCALYGAHILQVRRSAGSPR